MSYKQTKSFLIMSILLNIEFIISILQLGHLEVKWACTYWKIWVWLHMDGHLI